MKITNESYNVWNCSARSIARWQGNGFMEVYAWLLSITIVHTATTPTTTATTEHLADINRFHMNMNKKKLYSILQNKYETYE